MGKYTVRFPGHDEDRAVFCGRVDELCPRFRWPGAQPKSSFFAQGDRDDWSRGNHVLRLMGTDHFPVFTKVTLIRKELASFRASRSRLSRH